MLVESAIQNFDYNISKRQVPLPESDVTKKLTNLFFKLAESWFDNLDSVTNNKVNKTPNMSDTVIGGVPRFGSYVWAHVSTKDQNYCEWHNHVRGNTINMVYYPSVPDKTATFSIKDEFNNEHEIDVEKGMMLLHPGWMCHKPNPPKYSNKHRVSINIGYLSLTRPLLKIKKFIESGVIGVYESNPLGQTYNNEYIIW